MTDEEYMERRRSTVSVRKAEEALDLAIQARVAAGNEEVRQALLHLLSFVPDIGFAETFWPVYGPTTTGDMTIAEAMDKWAEYRRTEGLDGEVPFFSEMYLYNLMGKEDARTILALLGAVARGLGYKDGLHGLRRDRRSR